MAPPFPSFIQSLLIVALIDAVIFIPFPTRYLRDHLGDGPAILVRYSLFIGGTFLLLNWVRKRRQGVSTYDFRIRSWWAILAIPVGILSLHFVVTSPLIRLLPYPDLGLWELQTRQNHTGIAALLCVALVAPMLEELIFRGVILDGFIRRYDPFNAVVVSSFLFGFGHLNAFQLVSGMVTGLFLGWVYFHTRSVGCCILGHAIKNLFAFVIGSFFPPPEKFIYHAPLDWTYRAIPAVVAAPFLFASIFVLDREFRRPRYANVWADASEGAVPRSEPDDVQSCHADESIH